jgi:hypothetical protein
MAERFSSVNRPDMHELSELVGPLYGKKDLFPKLQDEPGLVSIKAADGYEYCPADQFTLVDEYYALRPTLSEAWANAREFDRDLGEDAFLTLMRFKAPQLSLRGKSWWDILAADNVSPGEFDRIKQAILQDVTQRVNQMAIDLNNSAKSSLDDL